MSFYTHIIWDWNGTLLDDIGASLQSVNEMLERREMAPIGFDRYRECIGVPIRCFYEQVFDLSVENYENLLDEYNAGYLAALADCTLSEGAADALKAFDEMGITQLIVSSCEMNQLRENVEKYGVSDFFDAVLGADNFLAASKIERAEKYLNENKVTERGRVLVVGDLCHDADLADRIGADCVLLTIGHEDRKRLESTGHKIFSGIPQLLSYVENK